MNFNQMRYISETIAHGMNISRAAAALGVAQPVISRQIQLLEKELGVTIFIRSKKRILDLSEAGKAIAATARRMLNDAEALRTISAEYSKPNEGELAVATTYAHARYALPRVIRRYSARFPSIKVSLFEATPDEIAAWLSAGRVDLSISSMPAGTHDDLTFVPYETLHRIILVPARHPLLKLKVLTLDALAQYPIVTFHHGSAGGDSIENAFRVSGLTPRYSVRAANADVIKAYVQMGLGVGIVSDLATPLSRREGGLRAIDAAHLFPDHEIVVGMRKGQYVRNYVYEFLRCVAPKLDLTSFKKSSAVAT
jgi:LysR family cys regulon transcriptional activator